MNINAKIAVIGGTGKAGRYVVRELIDQGFRIKVLVRDPARLGVTSPEIEVITGNVCNPDSVYDLIKGCDAVISTLGQTRGEAPVFSQAAKNIVNAMEKLDVNRYIVLTGLTLDTPSDKKGFPTRLRSFTMKMIFRQVILDKQNEFKIIAESSLDWTIVRVPFIEVSDDKKPYEISLLDCGGSEISSASIADFLIGQIEDQRYFRKAPFIWSK